MKLLLALTAAVSTAHAYWLMGIEDFITTERIDPVVSPGKIAGHTHSVLGGSNFRFATNTSFLRQSECSSIPIPQDKSAYWFPHLYFQWNNGSFSSLNGGAVIDTPGTTTAFPDDFRMLSGDPTLRTYDPTSHAQQAITFLCLDFNGVTTRHNELPAKSCPSGVRAQINFPSCWDGKNLDSSDHKSHVAFLSGGPDTGSCSDPKFPVVLPRIFMELYWASSDFESARSQARNTSQPFVFSYGDPTGYGYHADFINGWDAGVLQKAVDGCNCNPYGDPTCCVNKGLFNMNQGKSCRITKSIDEQTTGTLLKLPGNNPVQPEGHRATIYSDNITPQLISPVFAYTGDSPSASGIVTGSPQTNTAVVPVPTPATSLGSTTAISSSTSIAVSASTAHTPLSSSNAATFTTSHAASTTASHITSNAPHAPPFSISYPSVSIPTFAFPTYTFTHGGRPTPATSVRPPASRPTPSAPIADVGGAADHAPPPASAPASGGGKTCSSSKKRRSESSLEFNAASAGRAHHRRGKQRRRAFGEVHGDGSHM